MSGLENGTGNTALFFQHHHTAKHGWQPGNVVVVENEIRRDTVERSLRLLWSVLGEESL